MVNPILDIESGPLFELGWKLRLESSYRNLVWNHGNRIRVGTGPETENGSGSGIFWTQNGPICNAANAQPERERTDRGSEEP